MPQATSLRLLLSSANHHYRHPLPAAPFFYLRNLSVSNYLPILLKAKKPQNIFSNLSSLPYHTEKIKKHSHAFDRNRSSLHKSVKTKEDIMEEKDGNARGEPGNFGFNRKRVEGRDGSDRPKKNLHLKVRKLNPANTISYVQILGTGMDTQDTSPSVLLFFDKQRFIFNAGEGLQRFCSEHKIKLSKIDHIFLSRVCSETAGGLPGLLLTLAGMGDEGMSVNVWGSSDLKYLVDAMKSFIPNAAMVHTRSFGPTPDSNGSPRAVSRAFDAPFVLIDDEVVKISAVLLKPVKEKSNDPNSSQAFDHTMNPGDVSVIYICELPEIKGKFDPHKAAALGLRPGPKFRELQLGISVKSDRRDIEVHPHDVMGPSLPGPIVLLVDCPTLSHFEELSSRQCLAPYHIDTTYDVPEGSKLVNCVIHLTPACITQTTDYQTWMMKFGAAQHIMAWHEMKNIEVPILKASARIAARLNYLCPRVFPSPGIWSLRDEACFPPDPHKNLMSTSTQMIPTENLLKFHLRPYANLGLDRSTVPSPSSPSSIIDELLSEIPEVLEASKQVSRLWSESDTRCQDMSSVEKPCSDETSLPSCLDNISREEAEIVLLGTGSSQPSKYRNVSSIFINLFARGGVLLDCGEGTLGQLKRRFGVHGADEVVKNLKCIWISHIHADHHTGLARILALRRALLKELPHEPIVVVGPRQLQRFLDAYQRLEDLDMQFVDCWLTTEPSSLEDMESYRKIPEGPTEVRAVRSLRDALLEAGLEGLVSFPVVHCPQAFGVSLRGAGRREMVPGWKIVYSGDTRPCSAIVEAARGATVLIHEATFEDGMADEAVARNHSTTKEAVEVGESAGAYRIILTHFSQRYPKIPVFNESHTHRTCIGFDLMSVNLADIHLLPNVVPFLKLLFKDENLDTVVVDESDDVELADAPASSLF